MGPAAFFAILSGLLKPRRLGTNSPNTNDKYVMMIKIITVAIDPLYGFEKSTFVNQSCNGFLKLSPE
jgi:hypothetical protein